MTTTSRAGLRALRRIQFGQEDPPGEVAVTTAFLVGKLGLKLDQEIYQPEDLETGRLASFERSIAIAREATLPFESDANYEQLMYFLSMAVNNFPNASDRTSSGTPDGAGTPTDPYTWTYLPNYTKRNDPLSFTVAYGDDVQMFYSTFVSCRQLEFSGQVGDVVKINSDLFGQQVTKFGGDNRVASITITEEGDSYTSVPNVIFDAAPAGGITAIGVAEFNAAGDGVGSIRIIHPGRGYTSTPNISIDPAPTGGTNATATAILGIGTSAVVLSPPSELEPVLMGTAQLYSNVNVGGVGGTGYSNLISSTGRTEIGSTLVDFNYRIMTGFNPMKYGDNRLFYTDITEAKRHVELDMTVAFNRDVNSWFDRFIDQSYGWYSLTFNGTGNNSLALRVGGKITEYNELTEREGQNIVKLKIMSEYDSGIAVTGGGRDMEIILQNGLNSIL